VRFLSVWEVQMRHQIALLSTIGLTLSLPAAAFAATLNTMNDVGGAIEACWKPPADAKDASVTLSFSFRKDGTLIGPPKPTHVIFSGDDKAKKTYVDAAVSAVQACTPLTFSPKLAEGIAGQVFTMPFKSGSGTVTSAQVQ
jgi:hypothetical protein